RTSSPMWLTPATRTTTARAGSSTTCCRGSPVRLAEAGERLCLNLISDGWSARDARWRSPAIVATGRPPWDATTGPWQAPATRSRSRENPEQAKTTLHPAGADVGGQDGASARCREFIHDLIDRFARDHGPHRDPI